MRRGLTLVEILMAIGILAMGILFVVSIIPSSVLSLQKAEDMQAAAAYGMELIEAARMEPPDTEETREFIVTINRTELRFERRVISVEEDLFDIVVVATMHPDKPPLRLATRVNAVLGEE
jgi:uncharacterized protein (TIGR02598 family)